MLNMYSLFMLIFVVSVSKVLTLRPVIVLSFEGFHPKYVSEVDTPFLYDEILPKSAGPPYMTSIFPTKSAVIHFSVATGGYPEDHGVYDDFAFNDEGGTIRNDDKQFKRNNSIKPIWIEVEEKGNHSAAMMWPGSEFEYHGKIPTYIQKYNKDITWEKRADTIVEWMRSDNKIALVMAYFDLTPCYDKRKQDDYFRMFKKKVDDTIKKIYTEITKITQDVDMIFMSDHGTETIDHVRIMKIEDYVKSRENIDQVIVSGPLVYIKPKQDLLDSELNKIKNHDEYDLTFTVETKNTFSSNLRLKGVSLDGIIILIAKYGYTFYETNELQKLINDLDGNSDNLVINENGYYAHDLNMAALFLAVGPSFKEQVTTQASFNIVEIYSLLKKLLHLPGAISYDQGKHVTVKKIINLLLRDYDLDDDRVKFYYRKDWRDWRLVHIWDY